MSFKLNPKVKDFLQENGDKTMLSFAWSCSWRLTAFIYTMIFAIGVVAGVLENW